MSRHKRRQPSRRQRPRPLLANSQLFPLPGLLEWVLAGRTLEDLQTVAFQLLSPGAQKHWQRWEETQETSELEILLSPRYSADHNTLEILAELERGIKLLQTRTQEVLEHAPDSLLYFSEPEIRQLRWLLGLSENALGRLQTCRSLQPFPLELRMGRRLIRYLARILRYYPRRESLN
ncbi:MAG: hypothetical protein IRZ31_02165 [Thermogemmatispora sp.]|uniref:Uncharacterized protein n=1 Tax=Thermogemmatispora tikiterensis TaxID=1825093 RepID=A0A328VJF6_9CHLR|nr:MULTISPECIES: hypothetical protein [Thermogemmatispora]MBX5455680.1 hypothetical protein [Thermogemmatispora sp.]RAQ97607.1 hypothetical protein A4R35_18865 [Thermogemmatispora tikiterensis]